jgi:hypothetical protein
VAEEDFERFIGDGDDDSDYDLDFMLQVVHGKSEIICTLLDSSLSNYNTLGDSDPIKKVVRDFIPDLIKQARQTLDQFDMIFVDAQPDDDDE